VTTEASTSTVLSLQREERTYPPYDPFHGTNAPMLWRRVVITTSRGTATLEQTDYGHPGKLNDWTSRGVAPALQPKLRELVALAEAATAV
jgi:hypothetical protein